MDFSTDELWSFLPLGYAATILIETPILLWGLSRRHSWKKKIGSSLWLTACTYPIVVLVMPLLILRPWGLTAYILIAETFAPAAECALFRATDTQYDFRSSLTLSRWRDAGAIVLANLASFLIGEVWMANRQILQ